MALWPSVTRQLRRQGHLCRQLELGDVRALSGKSGTTDPVTNLLLQPRHYAAEPAALDEPCFSGRTGEDAGVAQQAGHQALVLGLRRIQAMEPPAPIRNNVMLTSTLPIRELLGAQAAASSGDPKDQYWISQWEKQLDMELESIDAMRGKYYKDLHSAIKRGCVADLAPTRRIMAQWLTPLAAKIRAAQEESDSGKLLGNDQKNWGPMIRGIDADVLATVTLQGVMQILMAHSADQWGVGAQRGHMSKQGSQHGRVLALGAAMALGRMVNERMQLEQMAEHNNQHNKWRNKLRKHFRELEEIDREVPREGRHSHLQRQVVLHNIQSIMDDKPELQDELLQLGDDEQLWSERFWKHGKGLLRNKKVNVESMAKQLRQENRKSHSLRRKIEQEAMAEGRVPWNKETKLKVGSALYSMLCETATVHVPVRDEDGNEVPGALPEEHPAFWHSITYRAGRREGNIGCHDEVLRNFSLLNEARELLTKRFMPMVIPPAPWTAQMGGGYLLWRCHVMRTRAKQQHDLISQAEADNPFALHRVYEALNALGEQGWKINKDVLSIIETAWGAGGEVGGLPPSAPQLRLQAPAATPRFRLVSDSPGQLSVTFTTAESSSEKLARRKHNFKESKREREQHSLRCDLNLKLAVARKMRDERAFYYPHNLDFRGRAYPMHIHLQHMSSDLCRSLLQFADARPLGAAGLRWLCIQLANSYGNKIDKLSFDGRHGFVLDNLQNVCASAAQPLRLDDPACSWWLKADDPWQCLAACKEVAGAYASGCPETYVSHHPIQVDGSCNGLQHYAALGRDRDGGASVNLVGADKPQDVYTQLSEKVAKAVRAATDGATSAEELQALSQGTGIQPRFLPDAARLLLPLIDRKLVKQTVMTSVYGVTYIGARDQIISRFRERGIDDVNNAYFQAACLGAKVTLSQLGSMFESANVIMRWLSACAERIAKATHHRPKSGDDVPIRDAELVQWRTPLGLPVAQPYSILARKDVRSMLQVYRLNEQTNTVNSSKQRTAFPPNFVHSVDSSHMMMTAVACKQAGLAFAGVHDSFWTHAATADQMNVILRDKFVELHSQPLLQDLRQQMLEQSPALMGGLPEVPDAVQPQLDLDEVRHSPYFFS